MNKYKTRKFKCIGCGKQVEARRAENKKGGKNKEFIGSLTRAPNI